jgi:hypothetical protein
MSTCDLGPEAGPSAGPFGPPAIVCGTKAGGVSAGQGPGFVWIRVEEEPSGADLMACIRQAHDTGLLPTATNTLVDLTDFHGVVDWSAIHAVRDMAPWGDASMAKPRVAYVSKDRMFAALIRLVTGLFPRARHRLFGNIADALAWLGAPPPTGSAGSPKATR